MNTWESELQAIWSGQLARYEEAKRAGSQLLAALRRKEPADESLALFNARLTDAAQSHAEAQRLWQQHGINALSSTLRELHGRLSAALEELVALSSELTSAAESARGALGDEADLARRVRLMRRAYDR